jgi:cytochrome c556
MTMFLRLNVPLLVVAVLLSATNASTQSPALRTAMREKLANTQGLLEAVVRADYPAVERHTDLLSRISDTEIASWQTVPTQPEYVQQAVAFLQSVDGLRQAASARNLDEVARQYTSLISSCMNCHTYVRTRDAPQ